jgi:predicted ATPase
LAQRDIARASLIPEKLYGREQEVAQLLAAFDRVANPTKSPHPPHPPYTQTPLTPNPSSEMMLVAGFSGIGKTAVVNEVHKPIVRQRGYFIKGKFDQFQRNIPFIAFVQAFRDLMGNYFKESDAKLANSGRRRFWRLWEKMGQVIIDVIPELEKIIGQQPTVPELSGKCGPKSL